jgi:hypothetical protein
VHISPESRVIGQVPAWIVGIVIEDDVVRIPEPAVAIGQVIRRNAEVESAEEKPVRAPAAEPVDIARSKAAGEVAVLPGMVKVIVRVAAGVADPAAVVVNMRRIGMAGLVAEAPSTAGGMARRGAMLRNKTAADVSPTRRVTSAGTLSKRRNRQQKRCERDCK